MNEDLEWRPGPAALSPAVGEVHLWQAVLDRPAGEVAVLTGHLTAGEREAAERILVPAERDRFRAARGILRDILGRYLGRAPGGLVFRVNRYGKLFLARPPGSRPAPHFNLTHSAGRALVAVTAGRNVGVDLERMDPGLDFERLAVRFLSPDEREALERLPVEERRPAFYRCWTRKEACLKAMGRGLSLPPNRIRVWPVPGEAPGKVPGEAPGEVPGSGAGWGPDGSRRWRLRSLEAGPGLAAAVAVGRLPGPGRGEEDDPRLICWTWCLPAPDSMPG